MNELENIKQELKEVKEELRFVSKMLRSFLPDAGKNLWMDEADVMALMNVAKRTLFNLRKDPKNQIEWRYAKKGKGVQYQRKSIEAYLQRNSTLSNLKAA